jgi:glycosyltransferase involved in cell wall biosynthesis
VRLAGAKPCWAVGVVIPACNEQHSIAACLASVLGALDRGRALLADSWIVVVADSCTDSTSTVAREILGRRGLVLERSLSSPGAARRLGTEAILAHFDQVPTSRLWIANTDADTYVTRGWIGRQLTLASRGYCGVAGIVRVNKQAGLDRATIRALLADYKIHDDGSHPHVHGANLGVRADAYIDAGCWRPVAVAEDHCLWSRVKARGWLTAACSRTIVHTSGRLHGRAVGGFADLLRSRLERLQTEAVACTR